MTSTSGTIGRWQGAGMMATTLLGTGVFILPQLTVDNAQHNALYAWLLLTLAIIPATLIFGKLSAIFPHAAGPAHFVEQAFGKIMGRSIGLIFLFVVPIGAPAALLMTFQFVQSLVDISGWSLVFAQLSTLVLLYFLNYRGLQVSAKLQFLLTLTIVFIVLLLFSKTTAIEHAEVALNIDNNAVLSAAGIAFWSFLGVEAMSHLSSEFRQPKKDMIPAMMIGTCLVGLIYIACTLMVLWLPNNEQIAMIGIFDLHFSAYGAQVIGVLGIAGGLATVNVYTASLARLVWSFSQQGVLPKYFSRVNRYHVPVRALLCLLLTMAIVIILTYATGQDLEDLINLVNGVFIIIYLATMLAAAKLLSKKYRILTALGGIFCLVLMVGIGWHMLYALVLLVILYPALYLQNKSHQKRAAV